jgi:hypothetical protein
MGLARNVVLMSVYFGSGKPQGVGISGRGPDGQVREIQGSVYEQPKEEVDGSCHSKEGSKKWKGKQGEQGEQGDNRVHNLSILCI